MCNAFQNRSTGNACFLFQNPIKGSPFINKSIENLFFCFLFIATIPTFIVSPMGLDCEPLTYLSGSHVFVSPMGLDCELLTYLSGSHVFVSPMGLDCEPLTYLSGSHV